MNRRGLLRALGGIAAAAGSGLKPEDLLDDRTKSFDWKEYAVGVTADENSVRDMPSRGNLSAWERVNKMMRRVHRRRDLQHASTYPANIATKRSWSPAFKEHCYIEEQEALYLFIERLEEEEGLAQRIFDHIFGQDDR